ncbi:MAG TPA: protein kinase [Sedimentisphaerales bacterium]|nr:protein kinase [Sedimentisphaerales bacterium]
MAEKPNDIEAIYNAALKKVSEAERSAYLDAVCGDDSVLRARVEALLKAHEEAGDFLEVPAIELNATLDKPPMIEGPGTMIGRYKLLELIGEGGMGLVYLAEQQEPVRRNVALKIVKLGMDTKQVIARFEAERQTLAVLDHPNIAHVFDAGTTKAGRPYFVMEYVEGMSITKYCDEQKLNIEERLELFRQVCEGVQHAHQKGIIHRDIKPSNILISNHGDKAVPKIIDFGIAKAITQPLTEETFFTHEGQLLGTPEYMSPEQVDLVTQDIDTRSDIYSLGVLLYVLLAGVLPFDRESLEHAGFAELQRTIREDEPPLPSTRLTTLGDKAKAIAESRRTQIITLTRRLHRELEWIPMKAMRKDRTRRYRSASELADDIQNYLTGTPLIAGPESTVYRARKFVRKHAGSVATAALLLVVIILGLAVSILMGCRAEQARQDEVTARKQVEQALMRAENAEKAAREKSEELRRTLYVNSIQLADAKYREANIRRVRELLESCPNDLRGWEWYRLRHIADQSRMTIHGYDGWNLAISPDGKHVASGGDDNTIKVWDAATGAEVMTLPGHKDGISSVAFSPDGKCIVSGSEDKTIKIWDAATGAQLMTLYGHEDEVISVTISPDSQRIASGDMDKTIKVWNAVTGTEVMTLRGHKGGINSVAFSPDGKRIASGSRDRTIKIWDAATDVELMTLRGHNGRIASVAFSPDGRRIVSAGNNDATIKIWDSASGDELMTLRGHGGWIHSIVFSPDGKRIVSGCGDNTIKVWDATIRGEAVTLSGHEDGIWSVAFSPDSKRIVGGVESTLKVWDSATGTEVMTLHDDSWSNDASFSPDGKRIVSGGGGKKVKVWDAGTGKELMTLPGHRDIVRAVAFSPDGRRIISGSADSTIKVWDSASGDELMTLRGHTECVKSVAFGPDGKRIVSGSDDKTINIWDAANGTELMTLRGHRNWVIPVAFSPDGKRIISGSGDNTMKIWDSATGAELMTRVVNDPSSIAFSPDGKTIAVGTFGNGIRLWESTTPAGGYEPRWKLQATRKVVDELYKETGFYSEVIDTLNADKKLAEPVRKVALQIANSHLWEDAKKLSGQSWEVVSSPGDRIEAYRLALGKAEMANRLEPKHSILDILGVAQYRVGEYQDALTTLIHVEKMEADDHLEHRPLSLAFMAMALYQLDRAEEAQATINRLRVLFEDRRWNPKGQAYVIEAEKLFAGENTKLYSVWEFIEEGRLKEAVQLIEKLRSLKDAESSAHIEGAVKWLSRAYYNRAKTKMRGDELAEAISDYEAAVLVDPGYALAFNALAWLRATCPTAEFRDGAKAIENATKACELTDWKKAGYVGTLAAAYAEAGDFDSAVKWHKKAFDLLPEEQRPTYQAIYESRLKLYQSGKPYRESP